MLFRNEVIFESKMEHSCSHDLSSESYEVFDDSFDNHSLSGPCTHSTPIKKTPISFPEDPEIFISSDSEPEIEVFDESTSSGKCMISLEVIVSQLRYHKK